MKSIPSSLFFCLTLSLLISTGNVARAAEPRLEAQLIWGTNDKSSPDPKHKPVEPAVKHRLDQLPLKFTNYFEVNRKCFTLPTSGPHKVELSDKCQIEVKKEGERIDVSLFGKGSQVVKRTQRLPKGEMLVVGGNAPNETAWLVIVKRIE